MERLRREPAPDPLPNGFELTELNPDFLRDPHPILDRLRTEAPRHVHAHSAFPDAPTGLYLTRMDDVRAIFSDPTFQRDPRATPPGSLARSFAPASVMIDAPHGNLLYLDGAQHRSEREHPPLGIGEEALRARAGFASPDVCCAGGLGCDGSQAPGSRQGMTH